MKIYKAKVTSTIDFSHKGKIYALVKGLSMSDDDSRPIVYTSPYGARAEGGIFAIPEINQQILVCTLDDDSKDLYYMSSVWGQSEEGPTPNTIKKAGGRDLTNPLGDTGIYGPPRISDRHYPQKIVIKDVTGHKLTLNGRDSPAFIDSKAELRSAKGKKVSLVDSPLVDSIIIKNNEGDGMTVGSHPPDGSTVGARSITLESLGSHHYICRESGMKYIIVDGRDINIENWSNGNNAASGDGADYYGNIEIKSRYRDIMLTATGEDREKDPARIFLNSNGVCQIQSKGDKVIVSAPKGIEFITDGAFKVKAGTIKMETTTGLTDIKSKGNVNIDGGDIHLNSKKSTAAGQIRVVANRYKD